MTSESVTARLRRPFTRHDSDDDSLPSAIDEQGKFSFPPLNSHLQNQTSADFPSPLPPLKEQETLIQTLSTKNTSQNTTYTTLLTTLPLLSITPYLLTPNLPLLTRLLAIKSLLATFFLLYVLQPQDTGFPALNAWAASSSKPTPTLESTMSRRGRRTQIQVRPGVFRDLDLSLMGENGKSPLLIWLPHLNIALAGVLALSGLVNDRLPLSLAWLPALVYGLVVAAKAVMAGVDPESELRALKYDYKGA